MTIISNITVLGSLDAKLLVATDVPDFPHRCLVEGGGHAFSFDPEPITPVRALADHNLLANGDLAAEPAEWQLVRGGGGTRFGRNVHELWTVRDGSTGFIHVEDGLTSVTLRYVDPELGTELPALPNHTYVATGLFAIHRGRGLLRLEVLDSAGFAIITQEAELSDEFIGGQDPAAYQEVRLAVRTPPAAHSIRYEIDLVPQSDEQAEDRSAYGFFTACTLVQTNKAAPTWAPRPDGAGMLLAALRGSESLSFFTASVTPEALVGVDELVVRSADRDPGVPTGAYRLPVQPRADMMIGELAGNVLKISGSGYDDVLHVFVDGTVVASLPRNPVAGHTREVTVLLDSGYFDDNPHLVEVRDASGFRTLARALCVFPSTLIPWNVLQEHAGHPLPSRLAPAAAYRYRALLDALQRAGERRDTTVAADLVRLHRVLEGGFEQLQTFEPLEFPETTEPVVSVVVPVHDKFNITYYCLCALLFATNDVSFEVIVVDDGSSDTTLDIAEVVSNIVVVRNEVAQGFVRACNAGAARARGRYVVLLNNDTEVTSGWLDELVAGFSRFPDVGMTGSKLLYPDGRLQDAGGIVWKSGNPWNYGREQNPHDPRYNYARQADYLSGAAVMVRTDVWAEVGGLSDEFAPAYFEDTDLAFKVRDAGYATWYVPSSVVFHFEGLSNGIDVTATTGLKRFQEVNRPKFKRKWAAAVTWNGDEGVAPDLAKDRGIVGRVLFIDHQTPRPDQDAGSYAAVQEIRLVQSLGYKATFIATNLSYMGHYTDELNKLGVETIHAPFYFSPEQFLTHRGAEFDAVYITRYGVAQQTLQAVRTFAPQAKVLFCNADLHFLREMRAALAQGDDVNWERLEGLRAEEVDVMRRVDVVLSYNEVEHAVIVSHNVGATEVVTCPWVVEVAQDSADIGFTERSGIAFLGGYRHSPNVEAVEFFVDRVIPLLQERLPGVMFTIYGSAIPDKIKAMAGPTVDPVGFVSEVRESYDPHRVFVAPLLSGAGIKGKVLGAVAHGIPTVLSPIAAEGTGLRHDFDCMVATDPHEWVESIATLYEEEEVWQSVRTRGLQLVRRDYSFEHGRALMREAFEAVRIFNSRL